MTMQVIQEQMVAMMEPFLTRAHQAIERDNGYRIVELGVIMEEPYGCTIGINCQPVDYPLTDVLLQFSCTALKPPSAKEATLSGHVIWSRSGSNMPNDSHAGFTIFEASTAPLIYSGRASLEEMARQLPRLEATMYKSLRRGRPPWRIVNLWNQLRGKCWAPKVR